MNALHRVLSASLFLALPSLAPAEDEPKEPPSLLGPVTREQIEEAEPEWVAAEAEAELDAEAVQALALVEPGAEIEVYLGTWCSDSQRELARFWRALDENFGVVPFDVEYVAVDRSENRPPELERDLDLRYVPTFIVRRDGNEVGRMVEVSPGGIERDLLGLLDGSATGVVSARDDLGEPPAAAEVLARAREALGGEAFDRLESLSVTADCTGPRGTFVTEVISGGDGRVLFRQTVAGKATTRILAGDAGWAHSSDGEVQLLGAAARSMVRGHEFHLQVLDAERRFSDPRTVGFGELAGHKSVEVAFTRQDGQPLSIFYRRDDGLPVGMVFEPLGENPETITVVYDDWRTAGGVQLFGSFELTHGDSVFTYDYTRIELNAVDETLFEVPPEVEALIRAAAEESG